MERLYNVKEHCKIIDWGKMLSRVPDIGVVFWNLAHLDFSNMDLVFSSLVETVSIAVLSLLYSLVLGILFGMLAARNVFRLPVLAVATQSFFTFLRAIPTPVWVLLMLVCLGMGPEAGVAGTPCAWMPWNGRCWRLCSCLWICCRRRWPGISASPITAR